MRDLPGDYETLVIGGHSFKVVDVSSLKELYKRGLEATSGQNDEVNRWKHAAMKEKYEAIALWPHDSEGSAYSVPRQ